MVLYASAISPAVGLIENVVVGRDAAIMSLMLLVGMFTTILCKIEIGRIADTSVFKSGMVAIVCVLGVACSVTRSSPVMPTKSRNSLRRPLPLTRPSSP